MMLTSFNNTALSKVNLYKGSFVGVIIDTIKYLIPHKSTDARTQIQSYTALLRTPTNLICDIFYTKVRCCERQRIVENLRTFRHIDLLPEHCTLDQDIIFKSMRMLGLAAWHSGPAIGPISSGGTTS